MYVNRLSAEEQADLPYLFNDGHAQSSRQFMQALAIIDMQRWMFRLPERAAQLPALVPAINRLAVDFEASGLPVFNVRVVHKADRSTWSRLMLEYDYPCMIEGTLPIRFYPHPQDVGCFQTPE